MEMVKKIETLPVLWKDKPKYVLPKGLELARDDKFQEFKILVEQGFNVLSHDKNGSTSLHWASG